MQEEMQSMTAIEKTTPKGHEHKKSEQICLHLKMEGIHVLRDLLRAGDWMTKVDLMDVYFMVPMYGCIFHGTNTPGLYYRLENLGFMISKLNCFLEPTQCIEFLGKSALFGGQSDHSQKVAPVFNKIQQKWGPLEVDMFASRLTTQLKRFFC